MHRLHNNILEIFTAKGVFDEARNFVDFDSLWHNVDSAQRCSRLLCEYLRDIRDADSAADRVDFRTSNMVLLSADTIKPYFGALPITILAASEMNCSFAVWKESTDVLFPTASIQGTTTADLDCIIVQDVLDRGFTVRRMFNSIRERKWNLRLILFFVQRSHDEISESSVVADITDEAEKLLAVRPKVISLITTDMLRVKGK